MLIYVYIENTHHCERYFFLRMKAAREEGGVIGVVEWGEGSIRDRELLELRMYTWREERWLMKEDVISHFLVVSHTVLYPSLNNSTLNTDYQ